MKLLFRFEKKHHIREKKKLVFLRDDNVVRAVCKNLGHILYALHASPPSPLQTFFSQRLSPMKIDSDHVMWWPTYAKEHFRKRTKMALEI